MNFIRRLILSQPTGEVASIPSGKLFLSRSLLSPKGALECLYNDSVLIIKKSSTTFCYQLCVIRAYQEGEMSSTFTDGDEEDDDDDDLNDEPHNTDERLFYLNPELHVKLYLKDDGTQVIRWDDVSGDTGDCYEFVVDEEIKNHEVDNFMVAVYRCFYEHENGKSAANVLEKELYSQFARNFSPAVDPQEASFELIRSYSSNHSSSGNLRILESSVQVTNELLLDSRNYFSECISLSGREVCRYKTELRIFEKDSEAFTILTSNASIVIHEDDSGIYHLVSTTPNYAFSIQLLNHEKLSFFLEYLGLVFNYHPTNSRNEQGIKLLIKFDTVEEYESFRHEYLAATYSNVAGEISSGTDVQHVSKGLRSMKLSDPDFGIDTTRHKPALHSTLKKSSSQENKHFHKAVSSSELDSKNKDLKLKVPRQSSEIFLGAFRKTEHGIVFVSEITCIEDTYGEKHDSSLNLQDLRSKTLILRD